MKKLDLRVKRTNKYIIEAFIRLVEEKGFEQVTVQNIADEAMINRATFYAHYKDKQDLYEKIFDLAVESFTAILDFEDFVQGNRIKIRKIEAAMTELFLHIQNNRSFYLTIMDASAIEIIRKKLGLILTERYQEIFSTLKITEGDIEVPLDFIIDYMTSIFVGTLHWWLTAETTMTPDHLAKLVIKLVANGHLTVLGIEIEE
ncbi:TetR/AcrR family transcriptional regulator [Enterococcus sp. AZ154]|uniref:TetR/AcrR family transcriptional regulator n=1 Tax=unclassified Enterococcus TaxID=2608891 RepID=UPI000352858E|nr:TetR/AcrR family transcriptional regulator [uncultured Enterococcus sp.]EAC9672906.1 TetR/AcrR family transcriptional regulator [Listeria monocytogenes]EPH92870.1 transcriptional regulator, TetR family [Enterococcus faecalis 06-MB-DW-09]